MRSTDTLTHPFQKLQPALTLLLGLLIITVTASFVPVIGPADRPPTLIQKKPAPQRTVRQKLPRQPPAKAIDTNGVLIMYGKDLIAHTATYLGPKGKVARLSNGMNCQNCHLDAGTKPWGNNYGAVAATYPKFRERSGTIETIVKRVNDCIERSLNGKTLDSNSREMKAIVAYILSVGSNVPRGETPNGSGIWKLPYLDRAADPGNGKLAYEQKCVSCHGTTGHGVANTNRTGYTFPPLWGPHSYNQGAGLFRISRLAGYVKTNMPLGATWEKPTLTDEEAWDIAAYIESMPRPAKDLSRDWPNIAGKPIDHPFGPYADSFSEKQHKFGPFKPIKNWQDQQIQTRQPNR
ncbi:c-type cytochrome [uncultured Fibrella sp.]|uniref:c-type cytochrome n=1 Tax=uncultured Fibrella sp. TaxID=1284596 RepID=UPI0035C9932E